VRLNARTAATYKLTEGDRVRVAGPRGEARLAFAIDDAVPEGCVRIARGIPETAMLGDGDVSLERLTEAAVA